MTRPIFKNKIFYLIILILMVIGGGLAGAGWWVLKSPNTKIHDPSGEYILYLKPGTTLDELTHTLTSRGILRQTRTFSLLADLSKSAEKIKPGRYRITSGMSNHALLQKLRNGLQDPLKFTFNNLNYIEDFCEAAEKVFAFGAVDMLEVLTDMHLLDSLNIQPEMVLGYLLPNTYEIYWTTTPEGLFFRLLKEHERFWTPERLDLLKATGLTRDEVLVLASIIQKETNHRDELPRMAGVFINRLNIGMKLQADPTVKYAIGDLSIRRVLYSHLEYPSPYNTYHVYGLPPGVICAPNPSSIDAVLNHERHQYLYYAAQPGYNSRHSFAVTHQQHLQNARKYHAWLRQENIR